jgi:hypothetical protein
VRAVLAAGLLLPSLLDGQIFAAALVAGDGKIDGKEERNGC